MTATIRTPGLGDTRALLQEAGLPVDDLAKPMLVDFRGIHRGDRLLCVVGLEVHGRHALLRSVATARGSRGQGLATRVLAALERLARERDVTDVYLLTETADRYFGGRGYRRASRDAAPEAIAASRQFRELCPDSAVLMRKHLGR